MTFNRFAWDGQRDSSVRENVGCNSKNNNKKSCFIKSVKYVYSQTLDDNIYRASIASRGKKIKKWLYL